MIVQPSSSCHQAIANIEISTYLHLWLRSWLFRVPTVDLEGLYFLAGGLRRSSRRGSCSACKCHRICTSQEKRTSQHSEISATCLQSLILRQEVKERDETKSKAKEAIENIIAELNGMKNIQTEINRIVHLVQIFPRPSGAKMKDEQIVPLLLHRVCFLKAFTELTTKY